MKISLHLESSAFFDKVVMLFCYVVKVGFAYMPVQTESLLRPKERSKFLSAVWSCNKFQASGKSAY